MALNLIVDSLDEIPEAARGAYVEQDGKFKLDFEVDDNSALKGALQKERAENKAMKDAVRAWEQLGMSREEIDEILRKNAADAENALKKKGDFDGILKQHQDKWAKERAALETELNAAKASERGAVVGERVLGALAKANATQEGTDLLPERLAARIKFETVDGNRVLKILSDDGVTPMAGSGADGTATIDDLVREAMSKYPSLFKGSGAGGGGKPPGEKGGGGSGVSKKSDLKTMKAKGEFVEKYGLEAYESLPA